METVENCVIQSNLIGTNAAGTGNLGNGNMVNHGGGIVFGGQPGQRRGQLHRRHQSGAGNVIAFNAGHGISLPDFGHGNSFLGNSIFSNGSAGININTANGEQAVPCSRAPRRMPAAAAVRRSRGR